MSTYELSNDQRRYFGLDPVEGHWEKVILKGDTYRPDSLLYFEGSTIKRHIISTEDRYYEAKYDESTIDRTVLLPKTSKGKEKKLTGATLEHRQPTGVYLNVTDWGGIVIANYTTNTTFYSSRWETTRSHSLKEDIRASISEFIKSSPEDHLSEIAKFKLAKRRHVRFRAGDYFRWKVSRTCYGFGRILLDINKIRKKGLVGAEHGLSLLMGPPVLVQLFAYLSKKKEIDISVLETAPKLPSDVMMDNILFYGEYEIIGNRSLRDDEFDFPISYGESIDRRPVVFLQWGLIHLEIPISRFDKYLIGDNLNLPEDHPSRRIQNPYGYYSIGFRPHFDKSDLSRTIENGGVDNYDASAYFRAEFDLRNPRNDRIRREIFRAFGLDPDKSYVENCKLTETPRTTEILHQLYS